MDLGRSRTAALFRAVRQRGHATLLSSRVVRWTLGATESVATFTRRSRVADAVRWGLQTVRVSWLYRWFTTKPEAEVVVIDLRETVIASPVLAVFDRILALFARNWTHAQFRTVVSALSERVVRPVRAVSVVALAALLATLLPLTALGALSSNAFGVGLVATALALAGTRVRVTGDELAETTAYELLTAPLSPSKSRERD